MDIKIKGDLNGLSDQQLEFIKKKLKENNINGEDVTVAVLGEAGDNFASALKVITIKNEEEDFRIIAKITQNLTRLVNEMNFMPQFMFINEITMYTEILPMMVDAQKDAGVKQNDIFGVPICYGASNHTPYEIILLQDLMIEKYVMLDKFKPLPSDTIKLILKTLAKYHSLSYVLREKSPREYAELCTKIINLTTAEPFLEHNESFKLIGQQLSKIFDDQLIVNIIIDTIDKQLERTLNIEKSDKDSKYTVIVHGDCWTNNFLFQLQDDKPTKCIMIDYQMVRQASPVVDILHLLLNCTDYEARSRHYQHWLDYYHAQLEENLLVHGLKINNVYPKDKFESDLNRYSKTSLGLAIFASSLMIRKNEEIAKVKERMVESENMDDFTNHFNMSELDSESVTKIRQRIEDVINSCIDFGYINTKDLI